MQLESTRGKALDSKKNTHAFFRLKADQWGGY